ncbi:MAG: hypothetical protein K2X77_24235 [Candidatus Obscuribacterales bacterium]|jgi:hypothetical protein|nr:hypothetical protein [Candidatus Obscuribacterales bacterium]
MPAPATETTEKVHIFGIRHHGPGSARSLVHCFRELRPDCILIEGPPEGNDLVKYVTDPEMRPPVSMLLYAVDDPRISVYYPFAVFSPEWQAMTFGVMHNIPVRFMDLPQTNWLALDQMRRADRIEKAQAALEEQNELPDDGIVRDDLEDTVRDLAPAKQGNGSAPQPSSQLVLDLKAPVEVNKDLEKLHNKIRRDPLNFLAELAGYSDGERWWENLIEARRGREDVFVAIKEAMSHLRDDLPDDPHDEDYEPLREAHMRQTIRTAIKDGFERIAVVCGAWHAPALDKMPPAKEDAGLLKGLPKFKLAATWIPWTHGRLAYASGYGAGIPSPGWYHHLWTSEEQVAELWMSKVARLLREADLDASSAHIIETVRLAETLAALRGHPLPGLSEFSEATQSVLCFGNPVPMQVIHDKLIVGETLGEVPAGIPGTPLQKDLEREQKRLRMPAQAQEKILDLDLRNANDLSRSHLLHRLNILDIPWGKKERSAITTSTFHEYWRLLWKPEFSISLIEASIYGRTVLQAAETKAKEVADKSHQLSELSKLLDAVLLADMPDIVEHVIKCVENEAAVASDVKHLMEALPSLVQIARYGNVRKTDLGSVAKILDGLVSRVCVGLPPACAALDDTAAQEILVLINKVHSAISLIQTPDHDRQWQDALTRIAENSASNGLLAGRSTRLLFDWRKIDASEAARQFGLAVSTATEPALAASFVEGFLQGSGLVLIHDKELLSVADGWVQSLNDEAFTNILPLMRRAFSSYAPAERRQIGEAIVRSRGAGGLKRLGRGAEAPIDLSRADLVLPGIAKLLGVLPPAKSVQSNEISSKDPQGE